MARSLLPHIPSRPPYMLPARSAHPADVPGGGSEPNPLISPTATQHEPAHEQVPPAAAPLAGVRVLELARILAGPWAGQLLADLGADVVKVERPGSGDDHPRLGAALRASRGRRRPLRRLLPRRQPRQALHRHRHGNGGRPGADTPPGRPGRRDDREFQGRRLARYGLDHAALSALNPRLITCSITGFGQTGPYASRPGYDSWCRRWAASCTSPAMPTANRRRPASPRRTSSPASMPPSPSWPPCDGATKPALGAHLDMALLDVQTGVLANQAMNYFVSGRSPRRMGNAHPNLVPYQVFPTADGYVVVATGNDAQFIRFAAFSARRPRRRPALCRQCRPGRQPAPAGARTHGTDHAFHHGGFARRAGARRRSPPARSTICTAFSPIRTSPPAAWCITSPSRAPPAARSPASVRPS